MSSTIGTASVPQVVRRGTRLLQVNPRDARSFLPGTFRFTGVDAYELASDWSSNVGCGSDLTDAQMLGLFHSLGPDAVLRTWFFQAEAINKYSGRLDWAPLDRVVDLANQAGVHLVATLGNQDGTCDDGVWKGPSWYAGGYRSGSPGRVSFATWAQMVAARYRNSPAILAWEPVNEPRPDTCTVAGDCWSNRICPSSTTARNDLRGFFDSIGFLIRATDRNHLISDGAPPVQSCGTMTWQDLQYVEGSPGIDLMSFHDYTGAATVPSSTLNAWRSLATAVNKPVYAGENGGVNAIQQGTSSACPGLSARASGYQRKISAEFASLPAFVGWLFWNAEPVPGTASDKTSCLYQTYQGDPLLTVLAADGARARNGR